MIEENLFYDPALLRRWRTGSLPVQWLHCYPHIFDTDDLRIALTQPRYHFGEWFSAVMYAEQGYRALVEKYLYQNHVRKRQIIVRFFNQAQIDFLKHPKPKHQPPDLFVYRGREFFFVEVKRDGDRLSKSQARCFLNIAHRFGCEVRVVYVRAHKRAG